eukprot:TRINITY_DN16860_c0_g1_i4.p1 TRINITY_DN16860_c0_g1~~TRINITY_DN16860_c0_g1_i4.p1  ORF type:complete len:150 (+),score=25.73 TRINITY_DN16860_c0_g1_i4:122-571(+)
MESEKTRLLIETQRQRVIAKESETEQLVAMIQASKQAEMSRIRMEKEVLQKKTFQRIQSIETEVQRAKQKAKADAEFYKAKRTAEANDLKYTTEYLQYQFFQALRDRAKIYFGENLSDIFHTDFLPFFKNQSTLQQSTRQQSTSTNEQT